MTIDEADKTYTGCDKCVHADDESEICIARLCIHAIVHLKECYKPKDMDKFETGKRLTGYWSHDGSKWKNRWLCSECGYKLIDEQTRFCPDCGAYMSR